MHRSSRIPSARLLVCAAALIGAACAHNAAAVVAPEASSEGAAVAAPAAADPAATARPTPLGALRQKRIAVAYETLAASVAEWQLETYGRDCLLIFDDVEEWLVGCPEMSGKKGFVATGETFRGAQVLWNPDSLMVSDKHLPYEQIKLALVGTVGTHTEEKTGKQNPVLIVQEWDALRRHHPAFKEDDLEAWLGVFVHEAFHARQMWHPRVKAIVARWKSATPAATGDDLARFYSEQPEFRTAIDEELAVLRAATDDPALTAAAARAALKQWLALYAKRQQDFAPKMEAAYPGKDAWFMDGFEMFLEGGARYVEARLLRDPPPSAEQLQGDPTFKGFEKTRARPPSQLRGLGKGGPKYFYALGMYLCFVLDVADPGWKSRVFETDGLLLDQVKRVAQGG